MDIEFAVSPHSKDLGSIVIDWVLSAMAAGDSVLALVDASMVNTQSLISLVKANQSIVTPILSDTPMESYGVHGPILWSIGTESFDLLLKLLKLSNKKPALSLIRRRADVDIKTLRDILRWLALIETEEGLQLYCRYADTRVLPALLDQLDAPQHQVLSESIQTWRWIARDGAKLEERHFLRNTISQHLNLLSAHLKLSNAQYNQILLLSEADMVSQILIERMPDLLSNGLSGEFHQRISAILDRARAKGLHELNDFFEYAVVALSTYDDFAEHVCLQELWGAFQKERQSFGDWAAAWPENIWQDLEKTAQSNNLQ